MKCFIIVLICLDTAWNAPVKNTNLNEYKSNEITADGIYVYPDEFLDLYEETPVTTTTEENAALQPFTLDPDLNIDVDMFLKDNTTDKAILRNRETYSKIRG